MGTLLTPQPRVRRIRVLSLLSAATFLFFNSYGSINVAIPMIQAEFGSSLSAVQWIATMGLVLSSSAALCLGRMGDIVGRSRLYKLGVTLYAAGSALAAASRNMDNQYRFIYIKKQEYLCYVSFWPSDFAHTL